MKFFNKTNEDKFVIHDSQRYTVPAQGEFDVDDSNQGLIDACKDQLDQEGTDQDTKEEKKRSSTGSSSKE